LDEPTTGLDVDVRYGLWSLIDTLARRGTSVLLASHSLEETESHCHRIGILDGGRIVAEGSLETLYRLVPARAVAEIGLEEPEGLLARGRERAWDVRQRGARWLRYLAKDTTLTSLARDLEGLPVRSLSVRAVSLEDAYLEVTRAPDGQPSRPSPG
jgi:ABC-2 type transport system ATP-binding protein